MKKIILPLIALLLNWCASFAETGYVVYDASNPENYQWYYHAGDTSQENQFNTEVNIGNNISVLCTISQGTSSTEVQAPNPEIHVFDGQWLSLTALNNSEYVPISQVIIQKSDSNSGTLGSITVYTVNGQDHDSWVLTAEAGDMLFYTNANNEDDCLLASTGETIITTISIRFDETGIDSLKFGSTDKNEIPEYYTLEGLQISNPTHGIYLEKRGSQIKKVLR